MTAMARTAMAGDVFSEKSTAKSVNSVQSPISKKQYKAQLDEYTRKVIRLQNYCVSVVLSSEF
jgi:dephospho-CoA kinase